MRKAIFIIILSSIFSSSYSQSEFARGYNVGYKQGYCYQKGVGCISAIPPIAPMPNLNESSFSYSDGYNRGFLDGNNNSKQSPASSPYGRKSYTREYVPFKPDFEMLQRVLSEKQRQVNNNYNYSQAYSSTNKKITLYDYLTGTLFPDELKLRKLSPNLSGYNSQTRLAIKAKQLYYSYGTYPILINKGQYRVCAIVFDSNRNVEFVDDRATVWIDSDKLVEMLFFGEPYSKTNNPILKYDESVKKGMANGIENPDPKAKNYTWNIISFQEKSRHCLSEILVQPFSNHLVKKGEEFSVILLFNDVLEKHNNNKR